MANTFYLMDSEPTPQPTIQVATHQNPMRILLVEDEPQIADFLKMSLEAEFFAVDLALDGEKGSYLARTENYDLVILDNILPLKNGLEICKELRAGGKTYPILVLSVNSETNMKVSLLNAGADDYLIKPFSLQELFARTRALLRRPQHIKGTVLTLGNISLNSEKHTVMVGEKYVFLTRKEFILLEYLMKNQHTLISRGMILEHVWDMHVDPFSNTIDTHILSLRRKLKGSTVSPLIRTIHSQGFIVG